MLFASLLHKIAHLNNLQFKTDLPNLKTNPQQQTPLYPCVFLWGLETVFKSARGSDFLCFCLCFFFPLSVLYRIIYIHNSLYAWFFWCLSRDHTSVFWRVWMATLTGTRHWFSVCWRFDKNSHANRWLSSVAWKVSTCWSKHLKPRQKEFPSNLYDFLLKVFVLNRYFKFIHFDKFL